MHLLSNINENNKLFVWLLLSTFGENETFWHFEANRTVTADYRANNGPLCPEKLFIRKRTRI